MFLTNLYLSSFCIGIYIIMALLCLFLLCWSLIKGRGWASHWSIIVLETVINIFVVLDIALKLKILKCKYYFRSLSNIIDFILVVLIMSLYIALFLLNHSTHENITIVVEEMLYAIWLAR